MQFYSLAANTQMGIEVDEAIIYYLEGDNPVAFDVTAKFLDEGRQHLDQTIGGILAKDFPATPTHGLCTQCEAKGICPFAV